MAYQSGIRLENQHPEDIYTCDDPGLVYGEVEPHCAHYEVKAEQVRKEESDKHRTRVDGKDHPPGQGVSTEYLDYLAFETVNHGKICCWVPGAGYSVPGAGYYVFQLSSTY